MPPKPAARPAFRPVATTTKAPTQEARAAAVQKPPAFKSVIARPPPKPVAEPAFRPAAGGHASRSVETRTLFSTSAPCCERWESFPIPAWHATLTGMSLRIVSLLVQATSTRARPRTTRFGCTRASPCCRCCFWRRSAWRHCYVHHHRADPGPAQWSHRCRHHCTRWCWCL
jgi:hypothetical protein